MTGIAMHQTLTKIQQELTKVISQLQSAVPNDEPFGNAHNNWSFPGLTRAELIEEAQSIVDAIDEQGADDIGDADTRLQDYLRRLTHLQSQTIPNLWANAGQAVPTYLLTLDGLRRALVPALSRDTAAEAAAKLRELASQLRGMEARLTGLQPRTVKLTTMVDRIEQAYNAADQLPADLESLSEARQTIADLVKVSTEEGTRISDIREEAGERDKHLRQIAADAEAVLKRCETAYSAATSVGLAAAFTERSDALSKSMWIWVFGLVLALGAGSYYGSQQLHTLSELFRRAERPHVGNRAQLGAFPAFGRCTSLVLLALHNAGWPAFPIVGGLCFQGIDLTGL
ncbi:hypothetical protein [Cupriavidus necator]